MLGRIFRVVSGFFIACLAAALAKVLFAFSPNELQQLPAELVGDRLSLALPVATHMAIFSAPFALLLLSFAEARRWRSWTSYAAVGLGLALVGFFAQYASETGQEGWSVFSDLYPLITFTVTGLVGGIAYWLFSGCLAGVEAELRPYERPMKPAR